MGLVVSDLVTPPIALWAPATNEDRSCQRLGDRPDPFLVLERPCLEVRPQALGGATRRFTRKVSIERLGALGSEYELHSMFS